MICRSSAYPPACARSTSGCSTPSTRNTSSAVSKAARCLPILIPAVGPQIEPRRVVDMLDGLLLTGSPSNVHPSEYGCTPRHPETLHDPARDATTLPLIREAVRRDLPILAICRGLQELNVALGGTLHQRVHEIPGRLNHRPHRDSPEGPYAPAHGVALTPGGLLAGLAGSAEASGQFAPFARHRPAGAGAARRSHGARRADRSGYPAERALCRRGAMASRIPAWRKSVILGALRRLFEGLSGNPGRLRENGPSGVSEVGLVAPRCMRFFCSGMHESGLCFP